MIQESCVSITLPSKDKKKNKNNFFRSSLDASSEFHSKRSSMKIISFELPQEYTMTDKMLYMYILTLQILEFDYVNRMVKFRHTYIALCYKPET